MIDFACKTFDLDEIIKCSLGLTKAEYRLFKGLISRSNWVNTRELSSKTGMSLSAIQRCMKTLYEKQVVVRRQENLGGGGYTYAYKAKNRDEIKNVISRIIEEWNKKVGVELDSWVEKG